MVYNSTILVGGVGVLENLISRGMLYKYRFDGIMGIVVANSEADAKEKVIKSYENHGFREYHFFDLEVMRIEEGWGYFSDSSDVLEICSVEE